MEGAELGVIHETVPVPIIGNTSTAYFPFNGIYVLYCVTAGG